MNPTILAFISALAIYGLSSLTFPQSSPDGQDDDPDIRAEETAEAPPPPALDDFTHIV